MKRIIEPELMTEQEQAEAYANADFDSAHRHYPLQFAAKFPDRSSTATVLDLGCGPCDVTVRFAEANPHYTFHAVDGSGNMLELARRRVKHLKLASRIRMIEGLIPGAPIPLSEYEVIISTSFLHHLHDPSVLWQTIRAYGRTGTIVFVADLRRPASAAASRELVDRYSSKEPEILRRDFYNSLLAAFTPAEVRRQLSSAKLRLKVEPIGDRHMLVYGRI